MGAIDGPSILSSLPQECAIHPRTQPQADDIERAGKAYLLAYRQLNHMSIRLDSIGGGLTPEV